MEALAEDALEYVHPVLTYPTSREDAGHAAWTTLHNYAALFPKKPSPTKRRRARVFIKEALQSLPCKDCIDHGKGYMKGNRPKLRNRSKFFNYLVDFHNDVNIKQGKPVMNARIANTPCKHCNRHYAEDETSAPTTAPSVDYSVIAEDFDISGSFEDIKDASRGIIEELCDKADVPVPEIVFAPCPANPGNSCAKMFIDKQGQTETKATIYLNPEQFSPRTLLHETKHYIEAYKGDSAKATDEVVAEDFAMSLLKKWFPYDSVTEDTPEASQIEEVVAQDEIGRGLDEVTGGVSHFFEGLYKPFEEFTGMSATALNEINTPMILGYSLNAVQDLFLSNFGAAVTGVVTGLALFGVGSQVKELSYEDRRLVMGIGAQQFWGFIRQAAGTNQRTMLAQAMQAGEAIRRLDVQSFVGAVTNAQPQPPQQPVQQQQPQAMEAEAEAPAEAESYFTQFSVMES